jgi:hypothetical protein
LGAAKYDFIRLSDATKERLMNLRVPADNRDLHMQIILLVDQWKRAAEGSAADAQVVSDRTAQLIVANRWLVD